MMIRLKNPILRKDLDFMQMAYQLAQKGRGRTSPNPMVGAVVVKNDRIVGQGWHRRCGGPHAEIFALRQAGAKARGAKLYVTLEPCFHFGRTPPCVREVISRGVKEVIIGMKDPNPLTNGKSVLALRRAGIKVRVGFLEKELRTLNQAFLTRMIKKRPWVIAKIAQTMDGKIATANDRSKWITSRQARAFTRRLRDDFDAILVGSNTVRKDDPRLNAARRDKHLKKIILDSALTISSQARLFHDTPPQDIFLVTTRRAPSQRVELFRKRGVQVIIGPQKAGRVDLKWLFSDLAKKEITSILLEGGARVWGEALKARVVDKVLFVIAPKIFGDQAALSAVTGLRPSDVTAAVDLKITKTSVIGPDLMVEAAVIYRK